MATHTEIALRRMTLTSMVAMLIGTAMTASPEQSKSAWAQPPEVVEPAKPTDYVGLTKCAACHFAQYRNWKTTPHGGAFDILPAKYKKDMECLKCHATDPAPATTIPGLTSTGVSCEACHGPGANHASLALRFMNEGITDEGLERLHKSIQRFSAEQCIKCHVTKAHKEHPKFDRETNPRDTSSRPDATRLSSFFAFSAHEAVQE